MHEETKQTEQPHEYPPAVPCVGGLQRSLPTSVRVGLVAAIPLLVLAFFLPLWHIGMTAPQYPKGLNLYIHMNQISGGNENRDINEINNLNHYIGMQPIRGEDIIELDWMPFAFGIIALLTLRVAVIGNLRSLIDLGTIAAYVTFFALARFYITLHNYGHDLDPTAAVTVEPFMPVLIGHKQLANFHTEGWPASGSYAMFGFLTVIWGLLWWQVGLLWRDRLRAKRTSVSAAGANSPAS